MSAAVALMMAASDCERGMSDDRLTWMLDNWAEWMQTRASDYGRGYPSRASGGMGMSHSRDFDQLVATADAICAKAVQAVLEGLSVIDRCAVHHVHLAAVWRFPRLGQGAELAYERARDAVRKGLLKRGIE